MQYGLLPLFLLAAAAPMLDAQQAPTPAPGVRVFTSTRQGKGDRAVLGVSAAAGGERDTLGVRIETVMPGGPAEKAGVEEGDRIAAINGVSLRLPRDDAGAADASGAMLNRLVRELGKLKAGDEVTLLVWNGSKTRTVKVKTVAADDLTMAPARTAKAAVRDAAGDRPALGLALASAGSRRDTLGVFVTSVVENGPAEKAGVVEGDRIASINGVDLRVPKEDAGDWSVTRARAARLQHEVAKLTPGQAVELSVVNGGRSRSVRVTLGRASELERLNGFSFSVGDGGSGFVALPRIREDLDVVMPRIREELDLAMPRIRGELDEAMPRAMDEVRRSLDRMLIEMPAAGTRGVRRIIL